MRSIVTASAFALSVALLAFAVFARRSRHLIVWNRLNARAESRAVERANVKMSNPSNEHSSEYSKSTANRLR